MDIDIQQRWHELEETYSEMADEELESLAAQAYELDDFAKQALQRQLTDRGLKIEFVTEPPAPETADADEPRGDLDPAELPLVHCSDVWSAEEARVVVDTLHNAGVPAYLGPDLVEMVDDFHGDYAAKVEIKVRDADFQRAAHVLSQVQMPDTGKPKDDPGDYQARCPKCHSDEIVFLELDRPPASVDTEPKFHWHCDACGNDWEDDGVEEE